MTITDEMVEKACVAYDKTQAYEVSSENGMQAALESVCPLIRNQVIEECALELEKSGGDAAVCAYTADFIRSLKTKE